MAATTKVGIRLPTGIVGKVDSEAEREDRTRTNMIAVLLREALDARARAQEGQASKA